MRYAHQLIWQQSCSGTETLCLLLYTAARSCVNGFVSLISKSSDLRVFR